MSTLLSDHMRAAPALSRVAPYTEVRETHSAVVFLVGERAFKLKKPVDLGFLDFSSPTKRLRAIQSELELNRRLSPDVYLGISDLNDVDGKPLEHLLVMHRMPAARRLAHLVRTDTWTPSDLEDLARTMAEFHARATTSPEIDRSGSRDAVADRWESNIVEARPWVGSLLDTEVYADVCTLAQRYLAGREALFEERVRQGAVVDGHGDLLAEDIFMLPDGPRVLDCLDFDDRLRYLDRIDDVACLVMDLEHLGSETAGQAFLDAYLRASADDPPVSLVHHYVAYRAFMRAKVACLPEMTGQGGFLASSLLDLARSHLEEGRVRLILVGGPPGTGKTTAATRLARALPAELLSQHAVPRYDELLERAAGLLAVGRSVVLDASWAEQEHRDAAARTAKRTSSDLSEFRCVLPHEVASERLRRHLAASRDQASDAETAVPSGFDDWPHAAAVDTGPPVDAVLSQLLHRLQPWRRLRTVRPRLLRD